MSRRPSTARDPPAADRERANARTSLALTLALAERLADIGAGAHGREALERLFIDEGFGALDTEEMLETVVQAIEALPAHDRVVGIVTHLTPLADRMPAVEGAGRKHRGDGKVIAPSLRRREEGGRRVMSPLRPSHG